MKISVITVVKNNYTGLQETFKSIRIAKESFQDFDYIVIDGQSTDGTKNLIISNLDLITNWVSEKDEGIYAAMNRGAHYAKNQSFLYWLNSGDIFLGVPRDSCFRSCNSDVIFSPIKFPNGSVLSPHIELPQNEKNIFPNTVFNHQGFMIKKELFLGFGGYDTQVGLLADCLLMTKSIREFRWFISSEPMAIYDMNGITTKEHFNYLKSYLMVAKKLNLCIPKVIFYHKYSIFKKIVKILIPDALLINILKWRWG